MALKWIIGDFFTGNTSMTAAANQLPVIANSGDKISIDINGRESAVLTLSKNDIPGNWETFLKPRDRFVALVDPDLAWGSSVIWAGFINKFLSAVHDTIQIQATGLKEYLSLHIISNVYNATNTNPETSIVFRGATHQQLMANMIADCFSSTGVPSTAPRPPQILRNVIGSGTGTTFSHSVKLTDLQHYGPLIDLWRDELSDSGQEYRFTASWDSSAMTKIRWTGEVASAALPHFNETTTYTVNLNSDTWMPTAYSQSSSTDNMISRIIGHTKSGDGTTGSDYTTRTISSGSSILVDEAFNPGVELTTAQLNTQLTQRLNYNSGVYREANFERAYTTIPDLRTIMSYLGAMATFTGSGASQYFGLTMRIVGVSFSPSKKTVEIELAPKAARYPRLPKDGKTFRPNPGTVNTGPPGGVGTPGGINNPGDTRAPIIPPKKPGSNGTTDIPGGIPKPPEPIVKPPFTVPNDDFKDPEAIINSKEVRLFKTTTERAAEAGEPYYKHYKKNIDPTRSRFNHVSGEYIGLNMPFQTRYHSSLWENSNEVFNYVGERFVDLEIYSYNMNELFAGHSGAAYQDASLSTVSKTSPIIAENERKLVATIPQSLYHDISFSILDFVPSLPQGVRATWHSAVRGVYDYNFFCSEDFNTLYVQIMYNISAWVVDPSDGNKTKSWCYTSTKTLKGVRNTEGIVETWEDLGNTFLTDDFTGTYIYFSPSIYEINGRFQGFGGYAIPQLQEGVIVKEVQGETNVEKIPKLPYYSMNFYNSKIFYVDFVDFYPQPTGLDLNLPAYYGTGKVLEEFDVPYAVKVDYSRRKIYIGISRINNNNSVYYEGDFDNNFKVILQTQKETSEISFQRGQLNFVYQPNETVFKFSLNPAIAYKNNYIVINAEGSYLSTSAAIDNYRGLRYTRSKKVFTDSVSGVLNFPDIKGSGGMVKDVLRLFNYNANLAVIGAFHSYSTTANDEVFASNNPIHSSGFDYIVYNGSVYIVSNALFEEPYDSDVGNIATQYVGLERTMYWVGKFDFKDELL